jgi:hypothetical protein
LFDLFDRTLENCSQHLTWDNAPLNLTDKKHGCAERQKIADGVAQGEGDRVPAYQLAELKEAHNRDKKAETCSAILSDHCQCR